uniref:Uncharacterized protein n=1 Tax=Timema cristinae TaxID=61476 RepID=A0A7R9D9W2_TIMCR|nr:unnamed protein product [Timema cristinae]
MVSTGRYQCNPSNAQFQEHHGARPQCPRASRCTSSMVSTGEIDTSVTLQTLSPRASRCTSSMVSTGRYQCNPSNAQSKSITVHVLNGEYGEIDTSVTLQTLSPRASRCTSSMLANALVVLSSTAEDGVIEVRISGNIPRRCNMAVKRTTGRPIFIV